MTTLQKELTVDRRGIKALLFLVLAVFVTGCHSGELTPKQRWKEQILVLNIFSEPPTLDPGQATDATSVTILNMLFEPLMRRTPGDLPTPGVAESVDISEDGKTYTFHLRDSLWSNGDPLTAYDFEYAWKRVLSPNFPGDYAYQLYFIKGAKEAKEQGGSLDDVGVHATNDLTLVVELVNPTPFFFELLLQPCYLPVHKATVENDPNWAFEAGPHYVSNGPFKMDAWTHHNELVVVRNPLYWDAEAVKLNEIKMLMVEDSNTELALFEDGAIDWTGKPISLGIPTDATAELMAKGRIEIHPMAAAYYYLFNVKKPPFNNANIRRAFGYAIDRKAIVDNITRGGEKPATCIIAPPMSLQDGECFKDHNIAEAKRLFALGLKELKLTKDKLPPIILSYNTGEGHHKIAQAVQQQWKEAFGIQVQLENLEWKVYLDKVDKGDFMIGRLSWIASYNDPYTFLDMFQYKSSPNYTLWYDPNFVSLLTQATQTVDNKQRLALLKKAEQIIIDQMPAIPVYFLTNTFMKSPHLKGVYLSPIGDADFKTAYFEE